MSKAFLYGNGSPPSLNFKVVGGTTQPADPKENTIWVNTDVAITAWSFAPTPPETAVDGTVWLKTADEGIEINISKKNTILLYLIGARLYTENTWVYVEGNVYVNATWVQFASVLVPAEYTEVEYIQSTGAQYIFTELQPTTTMWGFEIDFATQNGALDADYGHLFGIRKAGSNFWLDTNGTNRLGLGTATLTGLGIKANERQQLKKHKSVVTCADGITTKTASSVALTVVDGVSVAIFGACNGVSSSGVPGVMGATGKMQLYRFKLFDENDALIADLVPCYRKADRVAGLWDRERTRFYINQGTGVFLVGDDIT